MKERRISDEGRIQIDMIWRSRGVVTHKISLSPKNLGENHFFQTKTLTRPQSSVSDLEDRRMVVFITEAMRLLRLYQMDTQESKTAIREKCIELANLGCFADGKEVALKFDFRGKTYTLLSRKH